MNVATQESRQASFAIKLTSYCPLMRILLTMQFGSFSQGPKSQAASEM